jgi:hypothetical protein
MQLNVALYSALVSDAYVHSEIHASSRMPSASRRLLDWLYKSKENPDLVVPDFSELTDMPNLKWSGPGRDAHALIDTYWVMPAMVAYSWIKEIPLRDLIAKYETSKIFEFDDQDIEFMEWVQMLLIHLKVHGYYSPRHWMYGVKLSKRQKQILTNYSYRSNVEAEYAQFMMAMKDKSQLNMYKADLLYWLSIPNWTHTDKTLRSGEEILDKFTATSYFGPENAFLFGMLFAYSEQEPIFPKRNVKSRMNAFWEEYLAISELLDEVD